MAVSCRFPAAFKRPCLGPADVSGRGGFCNCRRAGFSLRRISYCKGILTRIWHFACYCDVRLEDDFAGTRPFQTCPIRFSRTWKPRELRKPRKPRYGSFEHNPLIRTTPLRRSDKKSPILGLMVDFWANFLVPRSPRLDIGSQFCTFPVCLFFFCRGGPQKSNVGLGNSCCIFFCGPKRDFQTQKGQYWTFNLNL